jgi:hypothetical protein
MPLLSVSEITLLLKNYYFFRQHNAAHASNLIPTAMAINNPYH